MFFYVSDEKNYHCRSMQIATENIDNLQIDFSTGPVESSGTNIGQVNKSPCPAKFNDFSLHTGFEQCQSTYDSAKRVVK